MRIWTGLPFEILMKYQWYFRRVAALYQLEHPRKITGFEISRYQSAEQQKITDRMLLENKIRNAKSKVTQANNELAQLRAGWKELFPIEDHPKWQATEKKLLEKQAQLAMMERQLEAI